MKIIHKRKTTTILMIQNKPIHKDTNLIKFAALNLYNKNSQYFQGQLNIKDRIIMYALPGPGGREYPEMAVIGDSFSFGHMPVMSFSKSTG